VNDFVEECRREWRRLGVPDPVANEMAADLAADIDEAEAEGGSVEDVLGNSAFDPRPFAAAWADARGVTAPSDQKRPSRSWPGLAISLAAFLAFIFIVAAVSVGRHSVAVAAPVGRILALRPGSVAPPFRFFLPGPPSAVQHVGSLDVLASALFFVGTLALGVTVLYWIPWTRRRFQSLARVTGLTRRSGPSSR
jgi:hypothetical protein